MFNFKLVLLAIFLVLGCVLANVQQGEDNGAYVVEKTDEDIKEAYDDLAVQRERREEEELMEEEEGQGGEDDEEIEQQQAPRSRGGSPCTPPSSGSSSASASSSAASSSATTSGKSSSTSGKSATTSGKSATTSGKSSSTSGKSATTSGKSATTAASPTVPPATTGKSATTSGKSSTTTTGKSSSTGTNVGLCDVVPASQQPLKLLVPLYVYPGAAWDTVVSAASKAAVIAIVNPNSGPAAAGPDSTYKSYMTKLTNAGVEMVGYVYTSYGARAISAVKADIDTYASKYTGIKGIFFDEVSAAAGDVAFYTQAYNYVMSKGMVHSILNPGTQPAQGYVAISTSIVIFEEAGSKASSMNYASWVTCAPNSAEKANYKYKFAGIAHSTASGSASAVINTFQNKGIGLVYVTDGAAGCCTYNTLASYMSSEASTVQSLNG